MPDEVFQLFLQRYGKVYDPVANEAAPSAKKREAERKRRISAEFERLFPNRER